MLSNHQTIEISVTFKKKFQQNLLKTYKLYLAFYYLYSLISNWYWKLQNTMQNKLYIEVTLCKLLNIHSNLSIENVSVINIY